MCAALCTTFLFTPHTLSASGLQWGKPTQEPLPEVSTNRWESGASIVRDPVVVEAAWQDDPWDTEDASSSDVGPTFGEGNTRSVVIKRSEAADLAGENLLERSPRIAQRSDDFFDPFEEPEDDPLPELPTDEQSPSEQPPFEDGETFEEVPAVEPEQQELEVDEPARGPLFEETLERDPLEVDPIDRSQRVPQRFPQTELDIEVPVPPRSSDILRPYEQPIDEQLAEELQEAQQSCEDEIAALVADTIDRVDLSIRLEGTAGYDFPYECELSVGHYQPRHWPQITYNWKASALCHKPLYFEQTQLERYGHTRRPCVQPIISGAHFFSSIAILPYKMGLETPNECIYTLGHYRPGNCAPHTLEALPFTWRAALFQAGAVTGTAFIVP